MKNRIQQIIEDKNLTPSAFADEVNLSRAVVSHILHGRNKLSLDNVQKILTSYAEINPLWLISGNGPMYLDGMGAGKTPSLFDDNDVFPDNVAENIEYSKEMALKSPQNTSKSADKQQISLKNNSTVKVKKIAVFYSDNTYEEFVPGNNG